MRIETERLLIRPLVRNDFQRMRCLLQSKTFMAFSVEGALDESQVEKRFAELLNNTQDCLGKHALVLKNSGLIIGYCGLEPFILKGNSEYELGYRIEKTHRGFGFATEACLAVVGRVLPKLTKIYAFTEPLNKNSIRVLEKVGFSRVGEYSYNGLQCLLFQLEVYTPNQ